MFPENIVCVADVLELVIRVLSWILVWVPARGEHE